MAGTRKMVVLGLLVAIAGVLHAVEGLLPLPVPVPGVKLGLANIISVVALSLYGWRNALAVAVLRVVLGSLLGGAFFGPSFAMGFCGAMASTAAMGAAWARGRPALSVVGISVLGAAVHNAAQISAAAALVASVSLFWYLPYLILFALPTGLATGLTAAFFLARLPRPEG